MNAHKPHILFVLLINLLFLAIPPVAFATGTLSQTCSTSSVTIPNNTPAGVTQTLNVTEGGKINDLNVTLDVTHAQVSELKVTLKHVATGTSLLLFNQPGMASPPGCLGQNFTGFVIDDQGAGDVDLNCTTTNPAYNTSLQYKPSDPAGLAVFNGEDINGAWELNISDNFNYSTTNGTLNQWCLKYDRNSAATMTLTPPNGTLLTFGSGSPLGTPIDQTFVIQESSNLDDLWVYSYAITGTNASEFKLVAPTAFAFKVAKNTSYTFEVECKPTASGTRTATITLNTNITGMQTISYPMECVGIAASYSDGGASATLDLGSSNVNTPSSLSSQSLTLSETGNLADLKVTTSLSGNTGDFSVTPNCSSSCTIGKGTSQTFSIGCIPKAGQSRSATLKFTTNDPTKTTVNYTLNCEGFGPIVTSNPANNATLQFGAVQYPGSLTKNISISNSGNRDLNLSATTSGAGAGAFSFNLAIPTVPANGGSVSPTVTCTPPSSTGSFTDTLTITTDDPNNPTLIYHLKCSANNMPAPLYDSTPVLPTQTFNVGSAELGGTVSNSIYVDEIGNAQLDVALAATPFTGTDASAFTVAGLPFSIPDNLVGTQKTITVTCAPTKFGLHTATLNLTSNVTDTTNYPTPAYPVTCTGLQPGYGSNPVGPGGTIIFSPTPVGNTATYTLNVQETGQAKLTVDKATPIITGTNDTEFGVTTTFPFSINNGGSQKAVNLTCSPKDLGLRTAQLNLTSDDPTKLTITYILNCTGLQAVGPGYGSTPVLPGDDVDVGNVFVGVPTTATFDVKEVGTAVLEVNKTTNATITGANTSDFSVSPNNYFFIPDGGPNKTVTVTCTHSGGAPGTVHTATLNMTSSDTKNPTPKYNLKCTAKATPKYTSTPVAPSGTIDFGTTNWVGVTVQKTLTMKELGTADLTVTSPTITGTDASNFQVDTTVFPATIATTAGHTNTQPVTISCKPSAVKTHTAQLNLTTTDPLLPTITYTLSCGGQPTPSYTSTPVINSTIDCGGGQVGVPYTNWKVTALGTTGTADVKVTATITNGGTYNDFAIDSSTTFPVTAAVTNTAGSPITLKITPSVALVQHTATLQLTTNDPLLTTVKYNLTCTGGATPYYKSSLSDGTPLLPGSTIDFGNGWVGKPMTKTFDIEDDATASADLNVYLDHPELTGVTGEVEDFAVLAPIANPKFSTPDLIIKQGSGKKETVMLQCTPSNPSATVIHTATLHLISNDPVLGPPSRQNPTYTLKCAGQPTPKYNSLLAPGSTIDFGVAPYNQPVTQELQMSENGSSDLTMTAATITGTDATVFTLLSPSFPFTLKTGQTPKQQQTIKVQCQQTSPLKVHTATLTLTTNDPLQPTVTYPLRCTGQPTPGYNSSPVTSGGTIDFGTLPTGLAVTKNFDIQERGSADLTVNAATPITGPNAQDFSLVSPTFPVTLPTGSGTRKNVAIQCKPTQAGSLTATLNLTSNDPVNPAPTYQLKCTGVSLDMLSSPRTLFVSVDGTGQGHVQATPDGISGCDNNDKPQCRHIYQTDIEVTLTPVAEVGSEFSNWGGHEDCSDGKIKMTNTDNKMCIAFFRLVPNTLAVTTVGNGKVSSSPTGIQCGNGTTPCSAKYDTGTTVTLAASPDTGWQLTGWQGDCDTTGKVTLNKDKQCQAIFAKLPDTKPTTTPTTTPPTTPVPGPSVPAQVQLTIQTIGTGKGTLHSQAGDLPCTDNLESKSSDLGTWHVNCGQNTTVTLTATPDTGSSFGQWTGDCNGTTTTIAVTMDKTKNCSAQFDLLPPTPPAHHVLTVNKTGLGNGTVSNAPVQCGGQCHSGASPEQQAMLNQTIRCGSNGGKCQAAYPHQTPITLTATADAHSKFTGWRKDCAGSDNSLTVILDRDKNCEANFEPTDVIAPSDNIRQPLTISKGGDCQGTIVSQPDGISLTPPYTNGLQASFAYPLNTVVTLTATPDQDCQFVGFSGDKDCTTGRVTMPNQPVSCVATFEKQVTAPPAITPPQLPPDKAPIMVCPLTGEVGIYCNYEGQHAKELTVTNTGNISTVVLEGTIHNQGWIANATLTPNSTITGGVLTGYIDNQGLISDFEFRGETLTGGTLAGVITIDNPKGGIFKDVKLAANTTITGGRLQGHIEGDAEAPALLEKLKVMPGSTLSHVMIGDQVDIAEDVTFGPGITFLNQPAKPEVPGTVKPTDKPTTDKPTTPTVPAIKPTTPPTGEVKPTTPTTVVKPTTPAVINDPLDAAGQTAKDVTVGPHGKLSNVVLDGTILNQGVIKDATLQPGCHITGGILTGTIINNGCILTDVEFRGIQLTGGTLDGNFKAKPGAILQDVKLAGKAHLSGGTLKGQIQGDANNRPLLDGVTLTEGCQVSEVVIDQDLDNPGTLTNVEFRGNLLKGGTLAGIIFNNRQGTLQDVSLAANAILKGGKLTGNIRGDAKGPAILEDVTVTKDSYVENVVVGIKVKNQGTLANIEFRGDSLKGGILAGNITNTGDGLIDDVKLGDNAHLSGGKLGGTINGNPQAPATIEDVKIQAFTNLNNVVLGQQVKGLDLEHVVVGPHVTIQKPDHTDTKINYTDAEGQTSTDLTVGEKTHLSNAVLQGTTVNRGRISNSTVLPDSTVTGGILGGDIVNQGTVADVEFQGITLTGGTVSGFITNTQGGILKDVKCAPQTNLTGGKLQGQIVGDADSPARLENLTILEGSEVDNVEIGDNVEVAADVKFGPGVKFTRPPVSHVPALTTTVNDTQKAKGQRFNNLTVGPQGELAQGELAGTTLNQGTVRDSFIPLGSTLTGGTLTGQVMNQGTLNDIEFQGTQLTGGLLGGKIRVTRQGILYNVRLLAKTHLVGGFLKGRIEGDTVNPPLLEGVTVQHDGYVNNVILGDDVENNGTLANFEFRGNLLQGGKLAGKITVTGKGAFQNVSLAPDTKLQSVRLKGKIKGDANAPALLDSLTIEEDGEVENVIINQNVTNAGTIANAEFRGTNMQGGRLAGTIRNTQAGTFKDIRLAPNASLTGGNIEGQIFGESADEPALLEDVRVASGSFLENVMIGQNVTFPKEVKFGVHVRFLKMLVGRYYYWDGRGQWLHDLTFAEDDYLWNVVLQGILWNKGHLHNVKLQKASTLRGGILSGEIYNEGILLDFEFQGTLLMGGTLGGWIQVTRAGLIKEVNLAANAHLKGGKLQGRIVGEAQAPALLEWVVILSGSFVDNVVIGDNVEMEDNVTFGPGVKFTRQPKLRSTTTTINEVRDGQGQTWKDVTIGPQGKLFNAKLEGTVLNQGVLEDVTVQPDCTITGGILTGTIVNQGTLSDFEFQGTQLTGGVLAGQIKNTKAGLIQDVKFARQARLSGGKLKGRIAGDAQYRAWIETVTILEYSYVVYVIVGDDVENQGTLENFEFRGNLLKGGTLAGTVLATWGGIFQDVSFAANATLKGGRLRGHLKGDVNAPALLAELLIEVDSQVENVIIGEKVINQGTLTNLEFRGSLMIGGTYAGTIKNTQGGTFRDIQLAANARLEGGKLEAIITGEPGAIALLEDVNVVRGSTLQYVKIGKTTVIKPPVMMDTGVEFVNQVLGLNTLADNTQTVDDKGLAVDTQGRSTMTQTRFTHTIETTAGQQPNQAKITVKEAKHVKLSSTLALDPQHVGKSAELRLIATYQPVGAPATNLMRAGDQWVAWDLEETTLQPALSYAQLPSTLTVPIFEGDLSTLLGEFAIFVEYKLPDGTVVNNTKSQLVFSVVSDRSCPVYTLSDVNDINSFVSTFDLSSPKGSLKPIANQPGGQDIEGLALHPTNSDLFYGTAGDKANVGGDKLTGYFYLIDRKAGEVTAAGPTGFDHIMTIAVNPVDQTLWGWGKQTRNPDGRWNGLIMIDQETHQATPIKQFDYHKYDMSGLTWSRDGKKLYASSILDKDTTIWVYDRETQEIGPACTGFAKGRIIGIDLEPKSGRLLVGMAAQHNVTMLLLDPQTCTVVKQQSYADLRDKDLESIVWVPEECNDARWIGGEVGK